MNKLIAVMTLAALMIAPAALADTPSFNYIQADIQRADYTGDQQWGWGLKGSINPVGGLFFSGNYSRVNSVANYIQGNGPGTDQLTAYRADVGYEFDFADTVALYGEAGWATAAISGNRDSGSHVEAGIRFNALSIFELRAAIGHYDRSGGFDEYSGTVLLHFLPFTAISVGYARDDYGNAGSLHTSRWQLGLRWSF
ncbi:MAG TPA: outer membrane beta-barrel protein [Gammaproteobacteria bacterium]|nr:outer membrane beta-barrel protein [Gammaproteobacteria bacterium]